MENTVLTAWNRHHRKLSEGVLYEDLRPSLCSLWEQAQSAGADPFITSFPKDTGHTLRDRKHQSVMIYAYISRVMYQTLRYYQASPDIGFAIFDGEAVLLKLFGSEQFMSFARDHGIEPMTIWDMEHLGPNAVSAGLMSKDSVSMAGDENYCRLLTDTAIYFSPVVAPDSGSSVVDGGIAVIVPYAARRPELLGTAALIANDANIHMYMADSLHHMYEYEPRGLFIIDKSWKSGKFSITYYNNTVRSLFHLEDRDLAFRPVEYFIDPLPENPEFWDLLYENRKVDNVPMKLRVRGRLLEFNVSSDPFCNQDVCIQGVRLYITSLEHTAAHVSRQIGNNMLLSFDDIIGMSKGIVSAKNKARRYAQSDSNVLILGESGVGKDVFAQAIHADSSRSDKPFVSVNCGALPRELIASELFGYEHGAFTGARKGGHIGKFELANGGTIFLDEIGDMPMDLQVMLLQVIEKKSFTRIGGKQNIHVDVKIISATNANLHERIRQGKFRLDLYYRLSVLRLQLPALRDRENDVTLLARYFLRKLYERGKVAYPVTISPDALEYLKTHSWPGNVRELQNIMEGVVQTLPVQTVERRHIMYYMGLIDDINDPRAEEPLPVHPEEGSPDPGSGDSAATVSDESGRALSPETAAVNGESSRYLSNRETITLEELKTALQKNHYRREDTARELDISRKTLYRWMKKYNL